MSRDIKPCSFCGSLYVAQGPKVKLPEHKAGLFLTHNEHKNYYRTVAESIADGDHGYTDWVSEEEKQKAIDMDECWFIQWYPDTPVGFCILSASTLDALLESWND